MYFLTAFLWYLVRFIFFLAVAVGGVFLGKFIRETKR